MHPAWEHVRPLADDPAARSTADRSGAAERRPAGGARAERALAQRREDGDRPGRARSRARAGGRDGDRRRHLAGVRNPRPRALARRPAPARERAAYLRRPPARPGTPFFDHGHTPTRSASSSAASSGSNSSRRPRPRRSRQAVPRPQGRSRRTGSRSRGSSSGCAGRSRRASGRLRDGRGDHRPENLNPVTAAWGLQLVLAYLDHLGPGGRWEVEGATPAGGGRAYRGGQRRRSGSALTFRPMRRPWVIPLSMAARKWMPP